MTTPQYQNPSQGVQDTNKFSYTAAISSISSQNTTQTMLVANPARKGFAVYNDSNQVAYIAYAATASATAFTIPMQPQSYYETDSHCYKGVISIIWAAANGAARVTELT